MKNALTRLAMPVSAAFVLSACSTTPKEPEITAQDLRDLAIQFAITQVTAQGYSIGASCKNADKARAGFIAYSEGSKTYQLVLAEGNMMQGKVVKETDTTADDLQRRLNDHCFPQP
ncbi:MAG: hypothetical protein HYS17_06500 [Micavibrio aeruginosavorus]|uniref:Lipoprotein n=1 Tax=Micavibrio aeruginosavorus TaxID=349221 RepID=A0A7T5UGD4_9BACT|nr:MAG: hypothetical protein HYS17_06500 [Micavibrio aeruginosavorus]